MCGDRCVVGKWINGHDAMCDKFREKIGVSEKAFDAKMEGLEMVSCPLDAMYVV